MRQPYGLWILFKEAFDGWLSHKDARLAAALAYYTIFSLAPVLVIVVVIAGLVFGKAAAEGELVENISNLVSEDVATVIAGMVESASHVRSGLFPGIVGIISMIIGATGLFSALQDALNTIYDVRDDQGLKGILKSRLFSFLMVLGIGLLFLALLIASTVLSLVGRLTHYLPGILSVLDMFNFVLSFAVITLLFALAYKVFTGVKIKWSDVWAGAVLTSLLFTLGKLLLGLYLSGGRMRSAYGAAGSVIVVLFWFYFSAQAFLFGAEFTRVFRDRRNKRGKL